MKFPQGLNITKKAQNYRRRHEHHQSCSTRIAGRQPRFPGTSPSLQHQNVYFRHCRAQWARFCASARLCSGSQGLGCQYWTGSVCRRTPCRRRFQNRQMRCGSHFYFAWQAVQQVCGQHRLHWRCAHLQAPAHGNWPDEQPKAEWQNDLGPVWSGGYFAHWCRLCDGERQGH